MKLPYDNVPRHLWPKMERCVSSVLTPDFIKSNGGTKDTAKPHAIAVCYKKVVGMTITNRKKENSSLEHIRAEASKLGIGQFRDKSKNQTIASVFIPVSMEAKTAAKFLIKNDMLASFSGVITIQGVSYSIYDQVKRKNIIRASFGKFDCYIDDLNKAKGVKAMIAIVKKEVPKPTIVKGSVSASIPLSLETNFDPIMRQLGQDPLPEWVKNKNPRGSVVLVHGVLGDTSYTIMNPDGDLDYVYLPEDAVKVYYESGIALGAYADTLHNGQHSRIGKIIGQRLNTINLEGQEAKQVLDFAVEITDTIAEQNIPKGHYTGTSAAWTFEGVVGADGLLRATSIGWDQHEGAISFVFEPQKADCSIYEIYQKGVN